MNKKLLIFALISLTSVSCSNKQEGTKESSETKTEISQPAEENKKESKKEEPTIIGGEEKGNGDVKLRTPGGEGKDVTLIVDKKTSMTSIDLNCENVDVDGNEKTVVYIDGKENKTLQLSKDVKSQEMLDLDKDLLTEGKHTVEVIQEKDGQQVFYRQLSYTVKK